MALDNEPPGHNRLERMGLPGFGKNPPTPPLYFRPPEQGQYWSDEGIPLDGPLFGVQRHDRDREATRAQPVRTVHVMLGAVAIAVASLVGNYVQMHRLREAEKLEGNLMHLVEKLDDENTDLRRAAKLREYDLIDSEEQARRLSVELEIAEQQRERLLDAYGRLVLEREAAAQDRQRIPVYSDNRGGGRDPDGAAVHH